MHIDGTSFGSITIDGTVYNHDVWIRVDGSVKRRDRNHEFTLDEAWELLEGDPEIIVVGTGQAGRVRIEDAVVEELRKRGVELVAAETPKAILFFNDAVRKGRRVAAALHVTC